MSQAPQADPEWISMRGHHQQECAAFARQVDADRQVLHRRHEAEKEEFARRVEITKAELLGRHSQEEGAYWTKHYQMQLKTSHAASPPPAAPAAAPTSGSQATVLQSNATSATAPPPPLLPKPEPLRKLSLVKTPDKPRQSPQNATAASVVQQSAKQESKQASLPRHAQQQTKAGTSGARSVHPKQSATTSQKKGSKQEVETIDLCSSDDDILVEVSKADYRKKTVPTVASAPFRPSIPTATLQLFGETSQKKAPTFPTSIKREKPEVACSAQDQHPSHLPQFSQTGVGRPSTAFQPIHIHNNYQDRDTTAPNARESVVAERAASAAPPDQTAQSFPEATLVKESLSFGREAATTGATHDQQVQDVTKLLVNRATVSVDKDPFALQQLNQSATLADPVVKKESAEVPVSDTSDEPTKSTSDDDFDMDDVPLAYVNLAAMMKKLGATPPRNNNMDVNSRSSGVAKHLTTKANVEKTQLPSPSPSLTSAPSTLTFDETTSLLNNFKRPSLSAASRHVPDVRGRTVESRDSRSSSVTLPDKAAPLQRQASVVSQRSNISTTSRKRKQIDLSDDEQSDYLRPSPSFTTTCRTSATILGSPLKKPLKPKGPPPPLPSPTSPVGKKRNSFGFRTNSTITSPSTPLTPPRPTTSKANPTTPATPGEDTISAREKALFTPPNKRKAAIRAQSNVQKMLEVDEEFHTDDAIFRSNAQEAPRRADPSTAALGTRLRSMSITPSRSGTRSKDATATSITSHKRGHTREVFLKERAKGTDRLANRTRDIGKLIGDDEEDEDLDTSEFFFVGGVLLRKGQEGRLTDS